MKCYLLLIVKNKFSIRMLMVWTRINTHIFTQSVTLQLSLHKINY